MKRSIQMFTASVVMFLISFAAPVLPQTSAFASGGPTIVSAPTVTYGKQLFGNTATDDGGKTLSECVDGESWWTLPVLAGDQIKIDYEGGLDYMQAWNVGTTDFNIHTAPSPQQFHIGSNDKEESIIKAPVAGNMPLRFYSFDEEGFCIFEGSGDDYQPGPYDFTATVQHALAAGLTPITSIYTNSIVTGTASLIDGTPVPDGIVFNLVAKWHTSSAAYSAITTGGTLSFPLALPPETAGKPVRIVITRAEDASYQAVKSIPLKVQVAPLPVYHHRHHRHHHHHHRRHHHR